MLQIIINEINIYSRYAFLISNLAYFVIIACFKRTRKVSFFQVHHINLIGLLQSILITSWSFNANPNFENEQINRLLCFISELLWGTLKYIRAYSVLVLAYYRYLAVFKPIIYKKISKSLKYSLFTALLSWIISFLIFFISKYSTGSSAGFECSDGNGSNIEIILLYFGISNTMGLLIPSIPVILIYVLITIKLKKNQIKLRQHTAGTTTEIIIKTKRQRSLALQFFLINLLEIISFCLMCALTILPIKYNAIVAGNYFDFLFIYTLLEALVGIVVILIPITTLYFLLKR